MSHSLTKAELAAYRELARAAKKLRRAQERARLARERRREKPAGREATNAAS
jgi:hypothetical protein